MNPPDDSSGPIPGPVLRSYLRAVLPSEVSREVEADLAEEAAAALAEGKSRLRVRLRSWIEALRINPWALRRGFRRPEWDARQLGPNPADRPGSRTGGSMGLLDAKAAARGLTRRPRGAGLVVLTVTLAVGAASVVFSVFDGVLLTPLPYEDPDEVLQVSRVNRAGLDDPNPRSRTMAADGPLSRQIYEAWRDGARSVESIGAYSGGGARYGSERPVFVRGARVTSTVFDVLGVEPALGRLPGPEIDPPGAPLVVVLGHGFWLRELGGDPQVVGRTVHLDGTEVEVVAVMPRGFVFPDAEAELWMPLPEWIKTAHPGSSSLRVVARRRDGVSDTQVDRDLNAILDAMAEEDPDRYGPLDARVVPFLDGVVGETRAVLILLTAGMGLLLLSTAANASLVLMARTISRTRELATRTALGASRWGLVRSALAEALLLVGAGGLAGVILAAATLDPVVRLLPPGTPRTDSVGLHGGVVAVAVGVILVVALGATLLPTLKIVRLQPGETLRSGGRAGTTRRDRALVEGLVVAEVVLAFLAIGGAALLGRSFAALTREPVGFRAERLLGVNFTLTERDDEGDRDERLDAMVEALAARPEISDVAVASNLPFSGSWQTYTAYTAGDVADDSATVSLGYVSPDYFRVMGIRVEAGSTSLEDADTAGAGVVVSRTAARLLWPGEDPVGRHLRVGGREDEPRPVLGIVADVRHVSVDETPEAKVYLPREPGAGVHLALRADPRWDGPVGGLEEIVRGIVWREDPGALLWGFQDVRGTLDDTLAPSRFRLALFLAIAAVTILISVIGVYGVTSFRLSERLREFALRKALGASPGSLSSSVARLGIRPVVYGILLGGALAWWLAPLVADFLFRVGSRDVLSFLAGGLLLVGVAALAVLMPVRRVSGVDPVQVLRDV